MPTSEMANSRTSETDSVSQAVVSAVADATGMEPTRLEPLYHTLDPDALDQIFQTPSRSVTRTDGRIDFTMAGCAVTVYANGEVDVVPPSERLDDSLE